MKKKVLGVLVAVCLVLMIPVHAAEPRSVLVVPTLKFDGTTATCILQITGDKTTDKIAATMALWHGDTFIKSWAGEDYLVFKLKGTATVEKNETYELRIIYSVNGVKKTPVSITRTNK